MHTTTELIQRFSAKEFDALLQDIYIDSALIPYQRKRYIDAISRYEDCFGSGNVSIFSAPGRSEIGGNHTDHQHGNVLAASINLDAIAIVSPTEDPVVRIQSDGYQLIQVNLSELTRRKQEENTTLALIKGVLAGVKEHGFAIGGFRAFITSDVLIGAGLSSSAAFEVLLGTILSGLYNHGKISPIEIAIIGQYAENVYFGKPCGLMDQMASSVGNLVHIDFAKVSDPLVEKVDFNLDHAGYSLCITDTKGSHVDLTPDYAAIPAEMKAVASLFGRQVLSELSEAELLQRIPEIRSELGDRAVLRALHFYEEDKRVIAQTNALRAGDTPAFLQLVKASGASSFQYLQNVYTNRNVTEQNMSVALAVSEIVLGDHGVCRVHGGGFAGTIQAFVENNQVPAYREAMDALFGKESCKALKIRKYGGMQVL